MWHKFTHHIHNAIHKGKEHVKHLSDFGQKAWDTIGKVVKKTTHAVNSANAEASNFTGMHPMIDDGIGFLNRLTGGVNQVFDWYTKTDEKKNTIEQSFKDTGIFKDTGMKNDAYVPSPLSSTGMLTRRSAM
jgi:hypothetical protein